MRAGAKGIVQSTDLVPMGFDGTHAHAAAPPDRRQRRCARRTGSCSPCRPRPASSCTSTSRRPGVARRAGRRLRGAAPGARRGRRGRARRRPRRMSPGPVAHWWDRAVVYQVYVRSFADSDGDGIGDLEGLRQRLGHIASLGVDAIWLCPAYPSPQRDHGYDVADYFDVDPELRRPRDLRPARRRRPRPRAAGLLDMVPNHCSDQHPWFQAALRSEPGSDERARFWFRGRPRRPAQQLAGVFGGSVWTAVGGRRPAVVPGTFTPYQPDFDHRHPAVDAMFDRRAALLVRPRRRGVPRRRRVAGRQGPGPARLPAAGPGSSTRPRFRPEGHDVWRRWRTVLDDYIAEPPRARRDDDRRGLRAAAGRHHSPMYTRPDEFHQCFAFDLLLSPWHAAPVDAPPIGEAVRARRTRSTGGTRPGGCTGRGCPAAAACRPRRPSSGRDRDARPM